MAPPGPFSFARPEKRKTGNPATIKTKLKNTIYSDRFHINLMFLLTLLFFIRKLGRQS
jgi:hypothetical protein